jgi:regulator of nucleoside diphosphate kinase
MNKKNLILSAHEHARLLEAVERSQASWRTCAPYLNVLKQRILDATIVSPAELPKDRVAVGDRVSLLHARPHVREWVRLVYPSAHAPGQGNLSVLSPLGAALLGAQAGENVFWLVDEGPRSTCVEELIRDDHLAGTDTPRAANANLHQDPASPLRRYWAAADLSSLCQG